MNESGTRITIGSSPTAMLKLEDEGIASTHAIIYGVYEEEFKKTYAYIDTVDGQCVSLNGGSVTPVVDRKLQNGDIITIGKTRIKVTYLPDPDTTNQTSPFELTILD